MSGKGKRRGGPAGSDAAPVAKRVFEKDAAGLIQPLPGVVRI